ncbi:MAG TPA: hypothetical protein VGM02_05160 [Acidobacteriaceae bacterium]|jgi:hypothetical protein
MKSQLILSLMMCASSLHAQVATPPAAAHVSTSFTFTVNASLHEAAPLFGPEGERAWAGEDWDPRFVFPAPARDVEGAVFTLQHGEHTAVWVNTLFDLNAGHMQYVYVLGDLLATTIDVRLHAMDAAHTKVEVTYVRTALRPEANEHVLSLGKHDREQGTVWEKAINQYLQQRAATR